MNPKFLLLFALASLYAAPSLATFPLIFASGTAGTASAGTSGLYLGGIPAGTTLAAGTTTVTVAAGAVLLGALGLTIGKALILRELTGRGRSSGRSMGSRRSFFRRGKREALPEISDEEAAAFIADLLRDYQVAYA